MGDFVCACFLVLFLWCDPAWTLMFPGRGYNTVSPHAAICMLFMKNKHGERTNK